MDQKSKRLESELCKAVNDGDPRSVQALLTKGAQADVVSRGGVAAIHLAVGKEAEKNLRCLKLLLQNGVNPNVKSADGLTPLHIAAIWGCFQNLKLLLTNGGDPNLTDNDGNTPRQLAEQQDNRKCAQLLQEYQRDSGDTEEEDLPRFSYSVYSDQTDTSSYPDSEFSFSSSSSRISDFGECPLSSTRRSSFFNMNGRLNGRGLSHRLSDMVDQRRYSREWNSWACEGPSILSSTRMSAAGLVGVLPVVEEHVLWRDVDRISLSKKDTHPVLPSQQTIRKSVSFRDVDEHFPVFSPETPKQEPIEDASRSLPFDPTEYSDFLDSERMATVCQTQGIDVTSPDHVYVFCRESSESTDENLEKTVISQCTFDESDEEEQQPGNVKAVQTEKLGSGSSSGTTSSHYSSCDSDRYTSALEGPATNSAHAFAEECPEMTSNTDSTEAEGKGKKDHYKIGQAYPQPGSKYNNIEHLSDSFHNLALSETNHQNDDATALCNVADEMKLVTENPPADLFDQDLSFTPSPFVTGRTRSRLSRCSIRMSKTPESLLITSALFEDTVPTPVRSRRQTPRSQSSENNYKGLYTASTSSYYPINNNEGDFVSRDYQDTQSSTLRASSSVSSSQADTINLSQTVNDTIPFVESQGDTFILDKESEIMDAYEKNFAEIVKAIQNKASDNKDFLTDDVTSTDDGKSDVQKDKCTTSEHDEKEDEVWITEDCSSQPGSLSSSSSSSYFSPKRSREDSDPPCTPGTGCTPRYSMSRLSGWSRPRSLANISYTPGGRPLIDDVEEPVEYLYTDTEQGHKFIETHIPPKANTSLSSSVSTSSEETLLYDWRSMHRDIVKSKEKENQEPKAVPQKSSSDSDVEVLPETRGLTDKELRIRLLELGASPGPISSKTRPTYMRRLCRLLQEAKTQSPNHQKHIDQTQSDLGYSTELCRVLRTFELPQSQEDEQALCQQFEQPDQNRKWREGIIKSSFNYLLLDPRVTNNLPFRSHTITPHECFKTFVNAIFYVGKGKRSRPYSHLYEALEYYKGEKSAKKLCRKVDHILQVWNAGQGVISLHCFQNVIPVEAYTREACMVEAIGLKMLTNQKRGDYYGIVSNWQQRRKKELGIHLLYRAMQIFLAEGERQLRPADIRQ
ncbi:ankyrin repeat and LEM domain-containing protein 1 [Periophthalmus magnuspinnatus]|uniref:ankyrin repeat and LEM domain-containing protein 1 n=1 Tax=Periophthalmus magnuspinnatus TaxID=409849 RepID=UPI00145AAC10|nr:ankyrin repeat and LEM domain-containing protein 1 [Periophthalmus magnuspinnatus]